MQFFTIGQFKSYVESHKPSRIVLSSIKQSESSILLSRMLFDEIAVCISPNTIYLFDDQNSVAIQNVFDICICSDMLAIGTVVEIRCRHDMVDTVFTLAIK